MISAQKLSILVGATGSGKTSLIRAGLTPLLRCQRYDERSKRDQWPILLLRRWGASGAGSFSEIILSQVDDAIQGIEMWGHRQGQNRAIKDAEFLRKVRDRSREAPAGSEAVIQILESMASGLARCEKQSAFRTPETGLILVFDQFEEFLRAGGNTTSEGVGLIRDLYYSSAPFRLLICLRQEYLYALRDLEFVVGGLARRSMVLRPLPEKGVLEVVATVSENAGFPIDRKVAERILHMNREASRRTLSFQVQQEDESRVSDLLRLQAVLRELTDFSANQGATGVNVLQLVEFEELFEENYADGALERWIEAAIRRCDAPGAESDDLGAHAGLGSCRKWAEMNDDELQRQMRRIAIRIAPHMSSLDYKVPQEENALFQSSLGQEVLRLGLIDVRLQEGIRIRQEGPPGLNSVELGLPNEIRSEERDQLSGLARRLGWSPAKTADQLAICFVETLQQLARANILTPTVKVQGGKQIRSWELVHDQFGPSFTSWARKHRDSWDDCLSALVVGDGKAINVTIPEIRPRERTERLDLTHLSWPGCTIAPVGPDRLRFQDTRFADCFLNGIIFERCDFYGGGFESCSLDGAMFRDCRFFANQRGDAPYFERCDARNLGIVGSATTGLEFKDCQLLQLTIDRTIVVKRIRFIEKSRVVQAYFGVTPGGKDEILVRFDEGSRAFHCLASPASFPYLSFAEEIDMKFSVALPHEFWTRTL